MSLLLNIVSYIHLSNFENGKIPEVHPKILVNYCKRITEIVSKRITLMKMQSLFIRTKTQKFTVKRRSIQVNIQVIETTMTSYTSH